MTIVDFSTSRPSNVQLLSAGVTAVGRYIGWDCQPGYGCIGKNIGTAEAQGYINNGISIFLAFEYLADEAAHGYSQGHADGQLAYTQLGELGAPPDMAVYFAVDFDIPDYAPSLPDISAHALAKLGPVGQYFQAINALKKAYEVGAYGGYYAIRRLFDAGLIVKGWQTVAWSAGLLDSRAILYQTTAASPIAGGDIDIREHAATQSDFGQWPRPGGTPPPPPSGTYLTTTEMSAIMQALPVLTPGATDAKLPHWYVHRVQGIISAVYGPVLPATGVMDAATVAAVKAVQSSHGLTADGIVGPMTWSLLITAVA